MGLLWAGVWTEALCVIPYNSTSVVLVLSARHTEPHVKKGKKMGEARIGGIVGWDWTEALYVVPYNSTSVILVLSARHTKPKTKTK